MRGLKVTNCVIKKYFINKKLFNRQTRLKLLLVLMLELLVQIRAKIGETKTKL